MPTAPSANSNIVGFLPGAPNNAPGTQALSAAATWVAYSWVQDFATSLTGFRCFASALAGSLGANDLVCTLMGDGAGNPTSTLGNSNVLNSPAAAASWLVFKTFTGTVTLAAGTRYWAVISNANGVPATNNVTLRYGGTQTGHTPFDSTTRFWGYATNTTTNSGGLWTNAAAGGCGWRVDCADGTFYGLPVSNMAASTAATSGIYGTKELGVKFTAPANFPLNVSGLAFFLTLNNGVPTGNINFVLRDVTAASTIAQTYTINAGYFTANGWIRLYFTDGAHALTPGHIYRATIADSAGNTDSSSAYVRSQIYTIDTDANSLLQWLYGAQQTYTTDQGSSWTDTNSAILPYGLVLDSPGEFQSTSGGTTTHVIPRVTNVFIESEEI